MSQQVKKIVSKITCVIMAAVFFVAGSFTFQEEYRAVDNGALICETGGVEKLAACLDELGLNQLMSYDSSKRYVFYHNGDEGQYIILEIAETSDLYMYMYPSGSNYNFYVQPADGCLDSYKVWVNDYALTSGNSNYWYFETFETDVYATSKFGCPVGSIWVDGNWNYSYFSDDGGIYEGVIYSDINVVLESYMCVNYGWNWQSYIVDFDKYVFDVGGSDSDALMSKLNSVGITSLPSVFNSSYNHFLYRYRVGDIDYYYLVGFDSLDLVDILVTRTKKDGLVYLTYDAIPLDSSFNGWYLQLYNPTNNTWTKMKSNNVRFNLGTDSYIIADDDITGYYENAAVDEVFLYSDFDLHFSGEAVSVYGWPAVLYVDDDNTLTEEAPEIENPDSGGTDRPSEGGTEIEDSGSDDIIFNKPDMDDDAIGNVGAAEDNLLKPGKDLDVEGALDVSIDPNAAKFIWDTVELFVTSNDSIFTLVIAMLSLGVVALILGR